MPLAAIQLGAAAGVQPLATIASQVKKINDTYGHDLGDKVLAGVGKLLQKDCLQGDMAARFGGEAFVIRQPDCPQAAATQRASGILGFDQLFKLADEAVYEAKTSGRNRVVLRDR